MTKKCFLNVLFIFVVGILSAQNYPSLNIKLLAHLNPETDLTGSDGRKYSGCWGWYQASKHKEYALVGTSSKTYFIDVTNPKSPVICDSVMARRQGCTWREIKNYQNYCYIVSDDAPPNSFQIVDMQYLPDSVHVVYDGNTYFERCHTIFVDKDNLYCGAATPVAGPMESMRVYNLANPAAPTLMRVLNQDFPSINFAHDMYVRNDTVYASCGGQGLNIFKYNGTNPFTPLGVYSNYPHVGYNHSSWQTDDRKIMVFADEVPAGLCAKVINVQDLNNITLMDTIRSNFGATAHNPYVVGNNWCWMSTYQDGLYLYDISNPSDSKVYGYFDTQPEHGVNDNFSTNAYRGNWGAYPYLPSKIVIALDMQNGIFILEGDYKYRTGKELPSIDFMCYPNPANEELQLLITNHENEKIAYSVYDLLGRKLREEELSITTEVFKTSINTGNFSAGYYFFNFKLNDYQRTEKIIIQK